MSGLVILGALAGAVLLGLAAVTAFAQAFEHVPGVNEPPRNGVHE